MNTHGNLPAVSYCLCGDQVIFLDIERNRYFALRDRENRIFKEQIAGRSGVDLLALPRISEAVICKPIEQPRRELEIATFPSLITCLRVAVGYVRASLSLKRHGLGRTLTAHGTRLDGKQDAGYDRTYTRLAGGFRSIAAFAGTSDNCLLRSLAFHDLARRRGSAPSLVIGVKTAPFAAHSWVQDGDTVLNDRVERVRNFTPILIV